LQIKPKYVPGLVSLGNLLFENGHPDKAAAYHTKALSINPEDIQALIGIGNALYELK
jgi:tetratricopeptide (TPR) repeat protein